MTNVNRIAADILTIGTLAKTADVPTSTIRFYERRGLLKADARSGANYRCYTPRTAERLKFIRSAQASGFSLKDVEEMLALTTADGSPCDDVAAVMERRLAEVRGRIRELRRVEKTLAASLVTLCKAGPDWCGEIERMRGDRPVSTAGSRRLARRA